MTAAHSSTDTDAPNASQDHAGWWRRGDRRKSSAVAPIINASASGQRRTAHTVATVSLLNPSPISLPNASETNANTASTPVVIASTHARPYFWSVGRSCLDAVDAVERPFELAHERRAGDDRTDEPEHEPRVMVRRTRRLRLEHRGGEEFAGGPGHGGA